MSPTPEKETPLMRQYNAAKAAHPDAVLLFRMGDFYETFGADAIQVAPILGITLTKRGNGSASETELAGFPHHALDNYLPKLVRAGLRVAICDQLDDPKKYKGKAIVPRGVTELITPGSATGEQLLQSKENSWLAAVSFGAKTAGVAFLDLSTGEFYAAEGSEAFVDKLLASFAPKEVLYPRSMQERFSAAFHGARYYTYRLDDWAFGFSAAQERLLKQLGTPSLKGFGVEEFTAGISAAGAVLQYLELTEHRQTAHIRSLRRLDADQTVWIDRFTARNLELFSGAAPLCNVIDRTRTPMGGRLLRRWLALPLRDTTAIARRADAVQAFVDGADMRAEAVEQIARVGDLERLAGRVATGKLLPREACQIRAALAAIGRLKTVLSAELAAELDPLEDEQAYIERTVVPDPSGNQIAKGGVIADGVDAELDEARYIAHHGRQVLDRIRENLTKQTGIPLKLASNNVFGYYIEVRNAHRDRVPAEWTRKQTLADAERYTIPELREYEEKILTAAERELAREWVIWNELLARLQAVLPALQSSARAVARVDVLSALAVLACERGYVRPVLDESTVLDIRDGRHPVIETLLPIGEPYIPNDVLLDDVQQQIIILTGPNMSGKSALLRQTALIVLLAQIGSFVPASAARIGVVDKIFTRVGASDNLAQGESTFLVEMLESANILHNVTSRSLVVLDEIGRGTSTYDGISIAWAMVEYLHGTSVKPRTLFATHYHELNELERTLPRVKNYHVAVRELEQTIVFLRKLERGGTEHSFGIHVARMAGMPAAVVERARDVLRSLEKDKITPGATPAIQLSMFQLDDPVLIQIRDRIRALDLDEISPREALEALFEIKKIL